MDIDEELDPHQSALEWITLFELSPLKFPWRDPIPTEIETRRNQMSDKLIFDLLLASARIPEPSALFPPTDVDSLRRLLEAISNSSFDSLKKDCVVYLLLKWHQDGRAKTFRESRGIPPQFVMLADAYWLLDVGVEFEKAVSMLSDLRITPEYPSKILQALSLSGNPHALIVKYIRTAKPPLVEPDDIDLYTLALAESCPSLLEAWQFQRTFSEDSDIRSRLIGKILDWCLSPMPRAGPLNQLLAFPFSAYEQSWVHKYALKPPPTCPSDSVPIVQDLVCVRLIQHGQYAAAVKLNFQFVSSASQPSAKMQRAIQDRKKTMDEIMSAMPTAEREMLESELELLAQGKSGPSISNSWASDSWTNIRNDMGGSWEDLRTSRTMQNEPPLTSTSTTRPFATSTISPHKQQPPFGSSLPPSVPNGTAYVSPGPSLFAAQRLPNANSPHVGPSRQHFSPLRFPQVSTTGTPRPTQPPSKPIPAPSLFSSVGSANMSKNAFYDPKPTNGIKRSLDSDSPRSVPVQNQRQPSPPRPPSPPIRVQEDIDVNMDAGEEPSSSLSYSLFGTSNVTEPGRRPSGRRVARTETEAKMPPGAYFESDDEEPVVQKITRQSSRRRATSSPPSPPSQKRNGRISIPGALMEEDEEEEDHIAPLPAPLPPSKKATRKNRSSSRASSVESEEQTQPRRSTRLSAHTTSSPEPPLKKTRKNAKTATAPKAPAAKSGSRKRK